MNFTAKVDFPAPVLFPNRKAHWRLVNQARQAQKQLSYLAGMEARDGVEFTRDTELTAFIDFYPPDRRTRDFDGLLSAIKGAIDGVCDAVGVDDKQITEARIIKHDCLKSDPHVVIELKPRFILVRSVR